MTCIGIIMGSESDMETMKPAVDILQEAGIPFECTVVSAHRTPERLFKYAKTAAERGLKIIVAGAGGAAHLPGMIAGLTTLPVLGVPVQSKALNGMDSLLSIVQMPAGVPVATFAIGTAGARNAALFAIQILALSDDRLALLCKSHKNNIETQALEQAGRVESIAGVPFHWEHKTK